MPMNAALNRMPPIRKPLERNENEGTSQAFTLRQFVIRRALRIFPAYFAFLLITALTLGVAEEQWWWYPLYLGNFRIAALGEWPGYWSHSWTLAVEEQLYVLAPLLVLLLQRKTFARVLPVLIAGSAAFILLTPVSFGATILLPKAFYSLLLGLALLAERRPMSARALQICGAVSATVSALAYAFEIHDGRLMVVAVPIACGALVMWATGTGPLGQFLEWKPLMHLGGMAYGLYLWHMPIPFIWQRLDLPGTSHTWVIFIMFSLLTYVLALLSWTLLEKPINRYKRFFPYHRSPAEAAAPVKAHSAVR